ncbi:12-oxophytodienoate reductase 1 [Globisporangium polare]
MATSKLFSPLTLGGKKSPITLGHRIVMAPCTRLRSGEEGVPPPIAVKYYAQRTTPGGLLVSEATNISPTARGYFGAPGIFNDAQIQGWQRVTDAVHEKGGKIFLQLWHTGRCSHPLNQPNGLTPVSSSATPHEGNAGTREGKKPYVTPRALRTNEIAGIVEDYRRAAVNAIAAGFDGTELHSGNGYLLEQFLCDSVNKRTDLYGGSVENRSRFLFEALEAILSSVDSSKVALRLSPYGTTFSCTDSSPAGIYGHVVKKLNDYDLAYLHLIEPRGYHAKSPLVPAEGVTASLRPLYKGTVISASGYDRDGAIKAVEDGTADAIGFGRPFIANPDLVKRLEIDAALNRPKVKTYYLGGEEGYTDYPFLDESA